MPGCFTHLKKEASIICDDVALIMEASFNLRYCGFTRLMGFIQGSFYIWMRYWINSLRACERMLTCSVHFFILCSCHILLRFPLKARYWSCNVFYYIHTKKYSPKSCVVNFDTQISSSQSEEWTMVFTRGKNDTSNQKPQRCVTFAPKFPPFLAACWTPLRTHSRRKVFLKEFFLVKKVKNISEMEWIKVNHTMPKKTKRQI